MKLPKIRLPNLFLIVNLVLIFSFLLPNTVVLAQSVDPAQTQDTYTQRVETGQVKGATSSATVASDDEGEVKIWFLAFAAVAGAALLMEELFGAALLQKGINCVTNFDKCVEGAVVITQNVVYKQAVGCDFSIPDDTGAYPDECSRENAQAIADAFRNGDENIVLPNGGLLAAADNIGTAAFDVPVPIESRQYFASINPFATARAQDASTDVANQLSGNQTLLKIWQKTRDASYALLVVILVIVGFLIMVRWKADSRTAITLQNSLPRIAIALLLITFSFAIAGFLADLIRILTSVVLDLLPGPNFNLTAMIILAIGSAAVFKSSLAVFGSTISVIALLLLALILIAIVFAVFINVMFKIITRYVIFILLTIFSPLFFLIGALPGADGVILAWFRRAAAALVAIPAIAFVIKLSFVVGFSVFTIPGVGDAAGTTSNAILPSIWFVPNPVHSIIQWIIIGPIVGLGIFFFATKVPEIVDGIFGIKPLPRGGIGPGAILGAPIAGLMFAGNVGRAMKGVGITRAGAGNFLRNKGWGKTPNPVKIKGGENIAHYSPQYKENLEKMGAAGPEINVPAGKDISGLSPDWQSKLGEHGMIEAGTPDPMTGLSPHVTKGGAVRESIEGELQQAAPRKSGVKARMARDVASRGRVLHGQDVPPDKPVFRNTRQISIDKLKAEELKGAPGVPGNKDDD